MVHKTIDIWTTVLTNGEIEFELNIADPKFSGGVLANLPDGVIYGEDNKGNMYLNGKPAQIEYRHHHIKNEGEWTL